jgi:tRNA(Ile)-lysidine synthase
VKGIGGIKPVRGRYIRPVLCLTRAETEEYCRERAIAYRTDSTNLDTGLSRNRIRHRVINELEEINDRAVQHICEAAGDMQDVEEFLQKETEKALTECVEYHKDHAEMDISILSAYHPVIATRLVGEVLTRMAGRSKDINRKHIEAVLSLGKGQSGRQIGLIYGLRAGREFGKIIIRTPGRYELTDSKEDHHIPDIRFSVIGRDAVSAEDITEDNNYTKYIDYATIIDAVTVDEHEAASGEKGLNEILAVRKRQPGDYISIKNGRKKLKDLLIEEKIPPDRRDSMYFVASGPEIIWIPDTGRIGERYKVTDRTEKVICMEMQNG